MHICGIRGMKFLCMYTENTRNETSHIVITIHRMNLCVFTDYEGAKVDSFDTVLHYFIGPKKYVLPTGAPGPGPHQLRTNYLGRLTLSSQAYLRQNV